MEQNTYIEKYRRESIILDGNRNGSDLNQPLIPGNQSNLNSHLLQLLGGDKGSSHPGHYLAPGNKWVPGRIPRLQQELKELEKKFEEHTLQELKIGNARPQHWPDHLNYQRDRLIAKLQVAEEEQRELEKMLTAAQEQQQKARPSLLMHPKHWGSGQLQNGILTEIGPWKVAMHSEKKVLCIRDDSSPYDGLEVHRFKALVVRPLSMEFVRRNKAEEQAAVAENRPRKKVRYPDPPSWNPETDVIEYVGIDNSIIKKLKQEN